MITYKYLDRNSENPDPSFTMVACDVCLTFSVQTTFLNNHEKGSIKIYLTSNMVKKKIHEELNLPTFENPKRNQMYPNLIRQS